MNYCSSFVGSLCQ